jgi:hypothetical protein
MNPKKFILSFDLEEFDTPVQWYGKSLSLDAQLEVSTRGLEALLPLLQSHGISATFFTTVVFAQHLPERMRFLATYYELASHGYYHGKFELADLLSSRLALEALTGIPVRGFRMANMMAVPDATVAQAGYQYHSSLNPIYLPGRYNHFFKSRKPYYQDGIWQIPASVTPIVRFPLFWLSFHNFPLAVLKAATQWIHAREEYVNLYFHPWEFCDVSSRQLYGLPSYVSRLSGEGMLEKLDAYLAWASKKGTFTTFGEQYNQLAEVASPLLVS